SIAAARGNAMVLNWASSAGFGGSVCARLGLAGSRFLLLPARAGQDRGQGVGSLVTGVFVDLPLQREEHVLAAPGLAPGLRILALESVLHPGRRHAGEPLRHLQVPPGPV